MDELILSESMRDVPSLTFTVRPLVVAKDYPRGDSGPDHPSKVDYSLDPDGHVISRVLEGEVDEEAMKRLMSNVFVCTLCQIGGSTRHKIRDHVNQNLHKFRLDERRERPWLVRQESTTGSFEARLLPEIAARLIQVGVFSWKPLRPHQLPPIASASSTSHASDLPVQSLLSLRGTGLAQSASVGALLPSGLPTGGQGRGFSQEDAASHPAHLAEWPHRIQPDFGSMRHGGPVQREDAPSSSSRTFRHPTHPPRDELMPQVVHQETETPFLLPSSSSSKSGICSSAQCFQVGGRQESSKTNREHAGEVAQKGKRSRDLQSREAENTLSRNDCGTISIRSGSSSSSSDGRRGIPQQVPSAGRPIPRPSLPSTLLPLLLNPTPGHRLPPAALTGVLAASGIRPRNNGNALTPSRPAFV
uniref:Uncharacterized protein n=1 Tax=Chromera velia CCMP2878 TaxID=1169474 RepID=A0A0G4FLN7_9ALVE|eukprot:Cvel_17659.t1-p1 / transcript=Cvel_17659.t1 / gene=Cvel_17659 / organism=Chromera_velia_CCMP2878 / gene_product=hypothetical protein / transcript_product=hypothetical protein / location=Cvel_scaffold1422:29616-31365(+) / protein_length=415 / sequence_SO=supercontig / SO=protein_coding / is_pseudo=false